MGSYLSIIMLNVNGLNAPTKRQRQAEWRGTQKPLDESESGEWKSWLKAQHSENSGPITSWEIDGETVETVSDFIFWHSASLCLLVGAFNPFTFKVIIYKYDPIAIYFVVLGLSLYTFSVFPV